MSYIPKDLIFNSSKPLGYPTDLQLVKFSPQGISSANGWSMSDTIRIVINSKGFWDPYQTYVNIEVDTTLPNTDPNYKCTWQVDSSAHSFIQQFRAWCNTELESIQQYDTLACTLNDIIYNQSERMARLNEGFGTGTTCFTSIPLTPPTPFYPSLGGPQNTGSTFGFLPHASGHLLGNLNANASGNLTPQVQSSLNFTANAGPNLFIDRVENEVNAWTQLGYQNWGYTNGGAQTLGANLGKNVTPNTSHIDAIADVGTKDIVTGGPGGNVLLSPMTCGFTKAFDNNLTSGLFEPRFTNQLRENSFVEGYSGNTSVARTRRQFSIPLLSGIFGLLMPRESFKLIPMEAFRDLIFEFTMSPYAMFTSGNNDQFATGSVNIAQYTRFWRITKFEVCTEIVSFDQSVETGILSALDSGEGILLHTQSWYLGTSQFINPSNVSLTITTKALPTQLEIKQGFESAKSILLVFIDNAYLNYTYCRKQFRLSQNVTSLYAKIGTRNYPHIPITGESGNIYTEADNKGNNSEFIINTFKAVGQLHDASNNSFINPMSFAINKRSYDYNGTLNGGNPLVGMYTNVATPVLINPWTAMGMPVFWENRLTGRAVYGIDLEAFNQDVSIINGVNTREERPFNLILDYDTTATTEPNTETCGYQVNPSTALVFVMYDLLLKINRTNISVMGRS